MTTPDVYRDAEYLADVSGLSPGLVAGSPSTSSTSGSNGSYDERMKKIQSTAKVAFIDRLLRDLDILIYCELSALYYMDCSIILFALRAIVQLIFFTPKAPPFDPTRNQPFVGAIFLSNLFCMLCHTLFAAPEAGEETRGYIHGGLFIDFIGQKAPVPLIRLLSMDVLVLLLDLVMLGLVVERVKTAEAQHQQPSGTATSRSNILSAIINGLGQDHDSEERGVLRGAGTAPTTDDQTQAFDSRRPTREERPEDHDHDTLIDERTELLADPAETGLHLGRSTTAAKDSHPLDQFASGQAVIMDVGLVDVVREQWRYTPATGRNSLRFANPQQAAAFMAGFRDAMNGRSVERNAQTTAATATATANNPNPAPDANGIVSA
ncbi:DUF1746-domain-containing protein [Aspergillus japonicus CBS 114.51]|uniref:DUF1746-domain-containing protein n=2 Tax=Aspergillus TaxID=5052 RepID=A0A2V5GWE5_ASPV1|nr:DUF1746-domain-containing protein [Aspergillus japonicus CBS 114.51]PYI13464.1 DUF1746-domain-containing protein [Aspergillus violaceofuscus CBS 115571]RAH83753.1 DUF1746-domain-containing protein [Aspergillus japonicus CBS 114.51]